MLAFIEVKNGLCYNRTLIMGMCNTEQSAKLPATAL